MYLNIMKYLKIAMYGQDISNWNSKIRQLLPDISSYWCINSNICSREWVEQTIIVNLLHWRQWHCLYGQNLRMILGPVLYFASGTYTSTKTLAVVKTVNFSFILILTGNLELTQILGICCTLKMGNYKKCINAA